MGRKGTPCLFDTDAVARGLFLAMLRDFRSFHDHFREGIEKPFLADLHEFRSRLDDFTYFGVDPARFKAQAQIGNLLKKWKFRHDVFSERELQDLSYSKYFLEQERLCKHEFGGLTTRIVLAEARKIARSILGPFDRDQHVKACRFGTNSSIGCPLHLAHIDHKLMDEGAFTSSLAVWNWFKGEVLTDDSILRDIIALEKRELQFKQTEFLVLKDVEKTWKVRRIIKPLPLLDLFYSNGIGELVTQRLKDNGIDISRQQHRHRKWVKGMSVSRSHATADLSAASDSITSQLLNAVLPREWYRVLKPILCHQVKLESASGSYRSFYTASVLPMGNGATFPVETLVFYCLIKAIGNLTNISGIYSAYGDDLIYPSRLHKYISVLFPKLGFVLNMDKTFVSCDFRESCGSDFYRGIDVRSFYLKGGGQDLTRTRYMAFLYGIVNGLLLRWSYDELPQTYLWLFTQLALSSGRSGVFRVPNGYPATAGVHTSSPFEVPMGLWNLNWFPVKNHFYSSQADAFAHPERMVGCVSHTFKCLTEVPKRRFTISVLPYYWQSLAGHTDVVRPWNMRAEAPMPQLRWHRKNVVLRFRKGSKSKSRTVVKWSSSVSDKKLGDVIENTGSVADWT